MDPPAAQPDAERGGVSERVLPTVAQGSVTEHHDLYGGGCAHHRPTPGSSRHSFLPRVRCGSDTLYYNITIDQYPFFGDDHALELKRALDQAIMHKITGKPASLSVGWKDFPKPPPRLHGYNVVATSGGTWYYVPAMIVFFCTLAEVVAEKESKLRVGMAFMGMRSPPCVTGVGVVGGGAAAGAPRAAMPSGSLVASGSHLLT